jgi:DNA-cytosine methyltransferase
MKVLSLFDGMSCGRIALDQLGIPVEKYYASEVDKYAMQVSAANYPDIIQVGDVCDLDPKDYMDVDLIQAGSPCQGFSMAGKQLAFDDPRSALFFEFIRLLKAIKPKYFLLENVRMKKEFLDVITEQVSACYEADDVAPEFKTILGDVTFVPHFINASLVSAQSRQRYYWTNIPGIKQPEDRGIVLRDILEQDPSEIYQISEAKKDRVLNAKRGKGFFYTENDPKIGTVVAGYHKEPTDGSYIAQHKPVKDTPRNRRHVRGPDEKSLCMTATMYKGAGNNGMTLVPHKPIKVGMNVEEVKVRKHEVDISGLQTCILDHYAKCGKNKKEIAKDLNDKFSTVEHYFRKLGSDSFSIPSEQHWPQLKEILGIKTNKFDKQIMEFEYRDGVYESTQRVYSDEGKSPTLTASNKEQMIETKPKQVGVAVDIKGHDQIKRVYSPEGKSPTVTTCGGGHREPKVLVGAAMRGRAYDKEGKRMDADGTSVANKTKQMLELRKDDKSNAITTVGKDSLVAELLKDDSKQQKFAFDDNTQVEKLVEEKLGGAIKNHDKNSLKKLTKLEEGDVASTHLDNSATFGNSVADNGKSLTLRASNPNGVVERNQGLWYRKLTPRECERLQTVPDDYTNHVSNTQRFKMLGNGWCVEVIKHIFKNMEIE